MIKMKKRLIGTGLVLATGILLSACGQSNTDTSTYSSTFSANPTTFNYLLDYYADNTAVITNLVDGLLENALDVTLLFISSAVPCADADTLVAASSPN